MIVYPKFLDVFVRDGCPAFEALTRCYDQLLSLARQVEAAVDVTHAAYKNRVGGGKQKPTVLKEQRLFLERERIFEAAEMMLNVAAEKLRDPIRLLRAECQRLRTLDRETRQPDSDLPKGVSRSHLRANVLAAETLIDTAAEYIERYTKYVIAVYTDEIFAPCKPDAREWLVQCSGHGSIYLFDGPEPTKVPDGPYMTHADANAEAKRLVREFECVGARFRTYNVRTGRHLPPMW